ncbi:229_t:CDS:1, partial [Funneliformis caledonium]
SEAVKAVISLREEELEGVKSGVSLDIAVLTNTVCNTKSLKMLIHKKKFTHTSQNG